MWRQAITYRKGVETVESHRGRLWLLVQELANPLSVFWVVNLSLQPVGVCPAKGLMCQGQGNFCFPPTGAQRICNGAALRRARNHCQCCYIPHYLLRPSSSCSAKSERGTASKGGCAVSEFPKRQIWLESEEGLEIPPRRMLSLEKRNMTTVCFSA